jgi:hypothetical protein
MLIDNAKSIWKFTLKMEDKQNINMPPHSRVLTAQAQNGHLCLWVLVNCHDTDRIEYPVWIYGTGFPLDEGAEFSGSRYVSTVLLDDGISGFHVFVGLGA